MHRRSVLAAVGGTMLIGAGGCSSRIPSTGPTIDAPGEALIDEDLDPRIDGLEPGAEVTVRAVYRPHERGAFAGYSVLGQLESMARFEADGDGVVDLSRAEPIEGTYGRPASMGPIWSMQAREELVDAGIAGPELDDPSDEDGMDVTVLATVDGETVATARIDRRWTGPGTTSIESPDGLTGILHVPSGDGPHPGLVVLHGSTGGAMDPQARQFAAHGFAAFALQYAEPDDPIDEVPLEYFDRAIEWLRDRPEVRDGRVGLVGWSMGGQAAMLVGTRRDDVGGVVTYGSRVRLAHIQQFVDANWTVEGEPLPSIPVDVQESERVEVGDERGRATRPAIEAALARADEAALEAATIPVERIAGPVLCVAGEDDTLSPTAEAARLVVDRLEANAHPYDYGALIYDDAGHSIGPPYLPTPARRIRLDRAFGGTPAGLARADADSWPAVRSLLERALDE